MKALMVALAIMAAPPEWRREAEDDGVTLDVQAQSDSGFENLRVRGTSKAAAETFARVWWGPAADLKNNPAVAKREVLTDLPQERLVYDVIKVPLGDERDYLLRSVKSVGEQGTVTIRFDTVEDPRRPPTPKRIRTRVKARLVVTPTPTGGCTFEYEVFTDIGGSLPPFLLVGPQRSGTLSLARDVLARAEAQPR